jgi:hypothetical protein
VSWFQELTSLTKESFHPSMRAAHCLGREFVVRTKYLIRKMDPERFQDIDAKTTRVQAESQGNYMKMQVK